MERSSKTQGKPKDQNFREHGTISKQLLVHSLGSDVPVNSLVTFLLETFPLDAVRQAQTDYFLGSSSDGRVIFWQVDIAGRIRSGKLMAYNAITGKRIKDKSPSWVHKESRFLTRDQTNSFHLKQCFFGEHLLSENNTKGIGVVESEKTAVILSIALPNLIWIACGGCQNLKIKDLLRVARKRAIKLFPDGSKYESWRSSAKQYPQVTVSTLLEQRLSEDKKAEDLDLADIIIELWKKQRAI